MENAREPVWWLPLLRRIVGWGIITAALLGFFPLIAFTVFIFNFDFGLPMTGPNLPIEVVISKWQNLSESLQIALIATWPFWMFGLTIGAISGFYAPIKETGSPLKSRFLRAVAVQTLLWWTIALASIAVGIFLVGKIFQPLIRSFYASIHFDIPWIPLIILVCISSFSFSLWRAINITLRMTENAAL